jgi:preprotein translocase subunit SecD
MKPGRKDSISLLVVLVLVIGAVFMIWKTPFNLGLDLQGGMMLVLEAKPAEGDKISESEIEQAQFIVQERVDGLGVTEPQIERQIGTPNIIIQLPGITDPDEARDLIRSTALLEFKEVIDYEKELYGPTLMTGKAIKSARPDSDDLGRPTVSFTLTPDGAKQFADITRRLKDRQLAIFLDGQEVSAPVIRSEIPDGRGEISGNFTFDEVKKLVLVLNTGALPVKLDVAQEQTIGPTLGHDSLQGALMAGLIGLALVALFLLVMYRGLGLLAIAELLVFASLFGGILALMNATLTLPGIAGIILTVGLAADSAIVHFERFREEYGKGSTPRGAARTGFRHAFRAMLDADATTVIIGVTLITLSYLYFGAGPVRGFAFMLSVGIAVDLFTAYFFTRPALAKLVELSPFRNETFMGLRRAVSSE